MPKHNYTPGRRFTKEWADIIDIANSILEAYAKQGYDLTLRGLYYQFIGHNRFPDSRRFARDPSTGKWRRDPNGTKNAEPNYKWLGEIMAAGRLAGRVDWNHLVDRTRKLDSLVHFTDPADSVGKSVGWYRLDMWENQKVRPEVWVEKEAQVGNMLATCQGLDVPLFACKGYTSASAMWRAAQRLLRYRQDGYETVIIHLGDHDPSGVDMSRDIMDRLDTFMGGTQFHRIALNIDQVRAQDLPPDPAKVTDSRAGKYIEEFGDESWEMDALEPSYINQLVTDTVVGLRDQTQWDKDVARHGQGLGTLKEVSAKFPALLKYMHSEEELLDHLWAAKNALKVCGDGDAVEVALDNLTDAISLLK